MAGNGFLMEMGIRIARCRKGQRMTQEQLAEQMGVSLQTVSCIELGKKAIRPENLANLCTVLGVSADYILYGKRTEQQMKGLLERLAELDEPSYNAVQTVTELLAQRKKETKE